MQPKALWRITVNGDDITSSIKPRLIQLTLIDSNGLEADILDISLDDSDGLMDIPPRGAKIALQLGWDGESLVDKGQFTVDELEHSGAPDQLLIRCRSADLREGITTKKERSWSNTTIGAIVRKIADENSYEAAVSEAFDSVPIQQLDQQFQSDADLLTMLAQQYDALCTVKNNTLLFMQPAAGTSVGGHQLPRVELTRDLGDRHRFTIRDRDNYVAVMATYYDTNAGKKGEVVYNGESAKLAAESQASGIKTLTSSYKSQKSAERAVKAAWKRFKGMGQNPSMVQASYSDKTGKESTVTYNGTTIGTTKASEPRTIKPIEASADNVKKIRHNYASKANAERAAKAEWDRLQRGRATFMLTLAKGNAELYPCQPVNVSGFKPAIDGSNWLMNKVTCRVDDNGFTTELEMELLNNEAATE